MGRKSIEIDPGKLEGMVMYGATCLECADHFDCSEDTIVNFIKRTYGMNFSEFSHKKQGGIRLKLKRKQIDVALSGNVAMLIWVGKQYLGQSDRAEQKIESQTSGQIMVQAVTKEMALKMLEDIRKSDEELKNKEQNNE